MDYSQFEKILNRHVFGRTLEELLRRLVKHPERFVGLFRPSTPREKILQNLIQAREIKFGDAMEEVVGKILEAGGFVKLESPSPELEYDHLYFTPDRRSVILIEQKVRDDHDSTKRRGQFSNFEQKVEAALQVYPEQKLQAIMYFLDPEFKKNRNFYAEQMEKHSYPNTQMFLFYGSELFEHINGIRQTNVNWDDIIEWLKQWRSASTSGTVAKVLDTSPEVLEAIAREQPKLLLNLAAHERLWEEGIIREVFPEPERLYATCDVLEGITRRGVSKQRHREQVRRLRGMIAKYYSAGGVE